MNNECVGISKILRQYFYSFKLLNRYWLSLIGSQVVNLSYIQIADVVTGSASLMGFKLTARLR